MGDHRTLIERTTRAQQSWSNCLSKNSNPSGLWSKCDSCSTLVSSRRVEQVIKAMEKGDSSIVLELRNERHFFFRGSNVQRRPSSPCDVPAAWRTTRKNGRGSRVRKVPANRSESSKPHNLPLRARVSQKTLLLPCFPVNYSKTLDSGQSFPRDSWLPSGAGVWGKGPQVQGHKGVSNKPNVELRGTVVKDRESKEQDWNDDCESGGPRKVASNDVLTLSQREAFVRLCIDYGVRAC